MFYNPKRKGDEMSDDNVYVLKKIQLDWSEDEKNFVKSVLRDGKVTIEFVKKDGSLRKMLCTLSESKIPSEKLPKNTGKAQNDEVLAVFDVENDGWRSFRWDSVSKIQFDIVPE